MNPYREEIINILASHDIHTKEDLNDKYYLLPREVQVKIEMLGLKASIEDYVRYDPNRKENDKMEVPMSIPSSEVKLEAKVEKAKLYWIVMCECSNPIIYGVDDRMYLCGIHESKEEAENSMHELKAMWESDPINFAKEILEDTYYSPDFSMENGIDLPVIEFQVQCVGSREIKLISTAAYME